MKYSDLREFIQQLEAQGQLIRVHENVSPKFEMTAVSQHLIQSGGPAVLFEQPTGYDMPALGNLFGTTQRVAAAMGVQSMSELRDIGSTLAAMKEPQPPQGLKDAGRLWGLMKTVWSMKPEIVKKPRCQEVIYEKEDVNLHQMPVQWCWPEDIAPLVTWGLVITRGPQNVDKPQPRQNLGVYRQQLLGNNRLIMRWLAQRGGALDFKAFAVANPGKPFPIAVAIGADPATILAAVTPIPDTLGEYQFAGLLRGEKTQLADCSVGEESLKLQVPANAEIVLEGYIPLAEKGYEGVTDEGVSLKEEGGYLYALEGPYGDHTGYYNEREWFPVFEVTRMTHRNNPIYHTTYTGKPMDEPAVLGVALNEVFVPLLQKQFPEITDFYLPPEGCSYRIAVVSIHKSYPGHAKRVMFGIWSFLRQFMYTKFIIVVDAGVDIRDWKEVMWAVSTRMDPVRDTTLVEHTPIDYLDFASPVSGLGGKMGLDATNKLPGETTRVWGTEITMDAAAEKRAKEILKSIGFA